MSERLISSHVMWILMYVALFCVGCCVGFILGQKLFKVRKNREARERDGTSVEANNSENESGSVGGILRHQMDAYRRENREREAAVTTNVTRFLIESGSAEDFNWEDLELRMTIAGSDRDVTLEDLERRLAAIQARDDEDVTLEDLERRWAVIRARDDEDVDLDDLELRLAAIEAGNDDIEEAQATDAASLDRSTALLNLPYPRRNGSHTQNTLTEQERASLRVLMSQYSQDEKDTLEAGLTEKLRTFVLLHFENHGKASFMDIDNTVGSVLALSPAETADEKALDNNETENSVETCAVCLDKFRRGDTVFASTNHTCPHRFHGTCILRCLTSSMVQGVLAGDIHEELLATDCDVTSMPCPCCRRWFCILSTQERGELWEIIVRLIVDIQVSAMEFQIQMCAFDIESCEATLRTVRALFNQFH